MNRRVFREVGFQYFPFLLHPQPVTIVVSLGPGGRPNGMAASWVMPVSRNPPALCIAIAPTRYTYQLIKETKDFTVNVLESDMMEESELFGRFSGRDKDKFSESKLTLSPSETVKSPHIAESVAVMECVLHGEFKPGDHVLVLGRVKKAYVREGVIENNTYNPVNVKILLHLGGKRYTTTCDEVFQPG